MLVQKYFGPGHTTPDNNLNYVHMMIISCMDQKHLMLCLFTYNFVTICKYDV